MSNLRLQAYARAYFAGMNFLLGRFTPIRYKPALPIANDRVAPRKHDLKVGCSDEARITEEIYMNSSEKIVVVFRSRLRADADLAALGAAGMRMYELTSAMPGFISSKDFTAEDGESGSIVEFTDAASLLAWCNHPEHLRIQQRGREEFMSEYYIQVCRPEREYSFKASD